MAGDSEFRAYVDAQLATSTSRLQQQFDKSCQECRRNMHVEINALQTALTSREADYRVLTSKLDMLNDGLTKVCRLLEGGETGRSLVMRMSLVEESMAAHHAQIDPARIRNLIQDVDTLKTTTEAANADKRETFRRTLIAAVPTLLQWAGVAFIFGCFQFFQHAPANVPAHMQNPPPVTTQQK
jgi:hypothetical protein